MSRGVDTLYWDQANGLTVVEPAHFPTGLYRRTAFSRTWRVRVKRPNGGHTWKQVKAKKLPKRLQMEALLLGVQL